MGGNFKSPFRSLQAWRNWRELSFRPLIPWLLRDEFSDTRAAGAVNGTPATPGPGGRVVTDTDVDGITISGGLLRFANPNGVFGDPGLWYGAVVRAAGRLCVWAGIGIVAANRLDWGLDANQAGLITGAVRFFVQGNLLVNDGGGTIEVSALPVGTYDAVAVMRDVGVYVFLRGGAFAQFTLLWVGDTGNTSPVYPAVQEFAGTGWTLDALRVPDALYLPTPLAYDAFARANGPLGNSEAVGPDGQTTPAHVWNNRVGTTLVAGNTASASALVGGAAIATVDTGTADVLQGAELTRAGGDVGVVVRYADATNYVIGYHDGINAKLDKVVAGVTTPVITAAAAYGAGRALWVICEGTQFSLYYNNAKIGATSAIADASLQNGTEQGLYSTNVGNSQDDMLTMARGTGDEYSALDRYSF